MTLNPRYALLRALGPFAGAVLFVLLLAFCPDVMAADELATATDAVVAAQPAAINTGDTAWILTSTALVLFMTIPGLALFYGGLVRAENVQFDQYGRRCDRARLIYRWHQQAFPSQCHGQRCRYHS